MVFWIALCGCFLIIVIVLFLRNMQIKHELRRMKQELAETRNKGYNRQITIALVDRDLSALAAELNHNLDYQKEIKLRTEQMEKQMKQSISDIAHDLRTPLTVVKGNLQLLRKEPQLSEQGRQYLKLSLEKADSLKDMVDDFFELSVLESDRDEIETKRINLTNLLMNFVATHEPLIREKNLNPDIRLPQSTVYVMADEQMTYRVLSNLLSNVLKYAKDSFCIELTEKEAISFTESPGTTKGRKSFTESPGTSEGITGFTEVFQKNPDSTAETSGNALGRCYGGVIFTNRVSNGTEIDVSRLFERNYRGSRSRVGTGAGLGLYIAKLLMEKQGGKIEADIQGEELTFRIWFQKPE